jgi:hypothetical protein
LIKPEKTPAEILSSVRLGTTDYDFKNSKKINEGGFGLILEIKSNVDGTTYVAKKLNFQVGTHNSNENETIAEREMNLLKL